MASLVSLDSLSGGVVLTTLYVWLPGYAGVQRVAIPASGAQAYVYVRHSLGPSEADVWPDDTGTGSPLTQPLTADADGRLPGYVEQPGQLEVHVVDPPALDRRLEVGMARDPFAITDVHVVASDAAMLAIVGAHEGTVAVRTDLSNQAFMNNGGTSGTDADWTQIGFGDVLSVQGHTGVVVLRLDELSAPSADVAMGGHRITGLGDATAGTDALNRETADARYDVGGAAAAAQATALAAVASETTRAEFGETTAKNQALAFALAIGG